MSNMKEIFKHHEDIGRRYKNLSYEDTHAIHKIFIDGDGEIKKLRDALEEIFKDLGELGFNTIDSMAMADVQEALKERE